MGCSEVLVSDLEKTFSSSRKQKGNTPVRSFDVKVKFVKANA